MEAWCVYLFSNLNNTDSFLNCNSSCMSLKCVQDCQWAEAGTAVSREGKCSEVKLCPLQSLNLNRKLIKVVGFFSYSKLQSELRTTNLEELKITVETYFQEVECCP